MNRSQYTVIKTDRRTLALQVKKDGTVIVRCPKRTDDRTVEKFVEEHKCWIEAALKKSAEQRDKYPELSDSEAAELKEEAQRVLPLKVAEAEALTGLKAASVKKKKKKSYFGVCTSENHIRFSYQLMRYPEEAIDYVVLHELAHTVHHNHSKAFWALVEKYMPDYKQRRRLLK